jgi:hypothetical protein
MEKTQQIVLKELADNIIKTLDTLEDGKEISPDWYAASKRIKFVARLIVRDEYERTLRSL